MGEQRKYQSKNKQIISNLINEIEVKVYVYFIKLGKYTTLTKYKIIPFNKIKSNLTATAIFIMFEKLFMYLLF